MKARDIKHRINGAEETVKITRAMQLVSASKMAKAEKRLTSGREFLAETERVVRRIGAPETPLLAPRSGKTVAYVVVTSDKGLCGDYNHKVLEYADDLLRRETRDAVVYPVGQFGREHFVKDKVRVKSKYVFLLQGSLSEEIRNFAYDLQQDFLSGESEEVYLVYTSVDVAHPSSHERKCVRLLPIEMPERETEESFLETQKDADKVLLQYVWAQMSYALACAEYAFNYKCMTAMQQATSNGEELVETLKKQFNQARQERITAELLDSRQDVEDR